ncbi:hypothetical protein GALMADRAFT_258225 [Galerina marginata CBS 339.88]|uniref:F-box domain-containing protein n=1 Tax=Galerina marginata (strain CBS 339.88) TaxID=685588 RepID=A0A067SLC2_GALM3|nr:hypothetical protein GALMADRAFT_258225 [Galerina marginata CBS 339.88]
MSENAFRQNCGSEALIDYYGPSLPFLFLDPAEICQLNGIYLPLRKYDALFRGNYLASHVSCRLRQEAASHRPRFTDLGAIFSLPLELILEIFEHLHPIDLYNLTRSSKSIRALLLAANCAPVWKAVFQRHPDVSASPPGVSLPKWVSMLFGPSTCDKCGHPEAMIDFAFLKRLCNSCRDVHGVRQPRFRSYLNVNNKSVYEEDFRDLVRVSYRYDAMVYPSARGYHGPQLYFREEVEERERQIRRFMAAIDANEPKAAQKYQEFKTETAVFVSESMKCARTCDAQCGMIYHGIQQRQSELTQQWKRQLMSLGHNHDDITRSQEDIHLTLLELRITRLTKKTFKRSWPAIQRALAPVTGKRLVRERRIRMEQRRLRVKALYQAYQRSLDPTDWQYVPDVGRIYGIRTIFTWISSELEDDLLVEAMRDDVPLYVERYGAYGRRQLSRIFAEQHPLLDLDKDPLQVAAAVFECPLHLPINDKSVRCTALIGLEDASLHFDCVVPKNSDLKAEDFDPEIKFAYSLAGFKTMEHLLGLLGLDPYTTLANDLETLDARFLCMVPDCRQFSGSDKGRFAMTLKECVSHAARYLDHPPQSFEPLSEEATESVIWQEAACSLSHFSKFCWSCKHCAEHFVCPVPRDDAITHVKESHSVADPVENTDFFYTRWKNNQQRTPYYLPLDPPMTYRCSQCFEAGNPRLWDLERLKAHLHDK